MAIYTTLPGDTFNLIARKNYGTDVDADRIKRANPGLKEPLIAGLKIIIPSLVDAPSDLTQRSSPENVNQVDLFVNIKHFSQWFDIEITRSLDAISTLSFTSVFSSDNLEFLKRFKPFSYHEVRLSIGDDDVFKGILLNPTPSLDDKSITINVTAYSIPGVLQDCSIPASAYPMEFNNQTLREIAQQVTDPFGIKVEFIDDAGAVFEKVASEPQTSVLQFLSGLAAQRNLLISSSDDGNLIFRKSVLPGTPVATFNEGVSPLVSVKPNFDAQKYYSHITALESVKIGLDGSQLTLKNELFHDSGARPLYVRPFSYKAMDTKNADLDAALATKMGRMFGNTISFDVLVTTWRDLAGNLWKPNTTILLEAPSAYVSSKYEFTIRSVRLSKSANNETALLKCVFPGAFRGEIPETLPWD